MTAEHKIVKVPRNSPAAQVQRTVNQLKTIRRFILAALKPDIDYGQIPGIDKKFLLQPGAEKIMLWLRVHPKYETEIEKIGDGHLETVSRCILLDPSDKEVFQGALCSCSTMESNFRFRWIRPVCPECAGKPGQCPKCGGKGFSIPSKEQAAHMKNMDMGKWVPEKSKDKKTILGWMWFERFDNPNIHNERNKVRQMGEKRALVKAVRNFGALSEIFTEDPAEWQIEEEAIDMPLFSERTQKPGITMEADATPQIWGKGPRHSTEREPGMEG